MAKADDRSRPDNRSVRIRRLRARAWAQVWNYENSFAAIHWWVLWWYKLDDALHNAVWDERQ